MMPHPFQKAAFLIGLLLAAAPTIRAANVFENVPGDALGFVVIRNLQSTNDKVENLQQALRLQFPGPLGLLKLAAGISDGLDPQGDLLFAILPGAQPGERPQFGIWLPVKDYRALVAALQGTPTDRITAVTVAGEDLLVAQHGAWALIMDPDQRDRMQQMLRRPSAPPAQIARRKEWIESNDVSAFLLPNGWQSLWSWAATDRAEDIAVPPQSDAGGDDLFGPATDHEEPSPGDLDSSNQHADDFWAQLREQIRMQLREVPQLARWAAEADALAWGVRADEEGNLVAGVRVALRHDWPISVPPAAPARNDAAPPTLYQSGDYIFSGTANLPDEVAVTAAGTYARLLAIGLKEDIRVAMDDEAIGRFQNAVEQATAQVLAASVLTRPGEKPDGAYSNAFLAVRIADAKIFIDRVADVMREWNEMNKSEEDESRLVFDIEKSEIGGRPATVYALDMVEAFGAAAIPEVRPSMERLFGPGGKLRLMVVDVDKQVVLLAIATDEQVRPVLDVLASSKATAWDETTNRLLPEKADWRLMASPQAHSRWLKRQMDAMLGPVIGAPLVRQFPSSPPVGVAGGLTAHEVWADAAVPVETIRATGQYLHQR